jgi:hypothetical protein
MNAMYITTKMQALNLRLLDFVRLVAQDGRGETTVPSPKPVTPQAPQKKPPIHFSLDT